MKRLLILTLIGLSFPVLAAVWRDPSGVWMGNICQTPRGWQVVAPQPVGTVCFSPGWNSYGFIANY